MKLDFYTSPSSLFIPIFLAVVVSGCASSGSVQSTVPATWSMPTEEMDAARATPSGHLVARTGKAVWVLDASGEIVYDAREKKGLGGLLKQSIKEQTTIGGFSLADFDGEQLTTTALPESNVLMVFDSRDGEDVIRAVSLDRGTENWSTTDHKWSLSSQKALGDAATNRLAAELSTSNTTVESVELFNRYAQSLAVDVPGQQGVLLKVREGLLFVDPGTGAIRWNAPDVTGTGIAALRALPNSQDLLVATNQTDLAEWSDDGQRLLRINARTGEIVWSSPYGTRGAPRIQGLDVTEDAILVRREAGAVEAYRLADGTALFQSTATTRTADQMVSALGGESALGGRHTASALVQDGMVFVPHTTNLSSAGRPDKTVIAYNLQDGMQTWEADPVEDMFDIRALRLIDGALVAHIVRGTVGSEQVVVAWDVETGSQLWRQDLAAGDVHLSPTTVHGVTDSTYVTFAPSTGETATETNLGEADLGSVQRLLATPNGFVALRRSGLTWMDSNGIATSSLALNGDVVMDPRDAEVDRDGRLFLPVNTQRLGSDVTEVHVVNATTRRATAIIRNLEYNPQETPLATNFPYGFLPVQNGRAMYVVDEEARIAYYRIPAGSEVETAP